MLRIIDNKAKKRKKNTKKRKIKNRKKRIIDNNVIICTELYKFVFYVVFSTSLRERLFMAIGYRKFKSSY